jgi:hypothetical protein
MELVAGVAAGGVRRSRVTRGFATGRSNAAVVAGVPAMTVGGSGAAAVRLAAPGMFVWETGVAAGGLMNRQDHATITTMASRTAIRTIR